MADSVGAAGIIVDLIGSVHDLGNAENEEWGRCNEIREGFERPLRELDACVEQVKDFETSCKSIEDEFPGEMKRSYGQIITLRKDKFDEAKESLEDLKTKISKSAIAISSVLKQWPKTRATDIKGVARAGDTSEMISEFGDNLATLLKECHEEMKGLHEKRGDQFTPCFY